MSNEKLIEAHRSAVEDEDNPEWTRPDFERATPASQVLPAGAASALLRKRGRPSMPADERKRQVTMRLSSDVVGAMRDSGPGWQRRVDEVLRAVFAGKKRASMHELAEAIAKTLKNDGPKANARIRTGDLGSAGRQASAAKKKRA